MTSPITVAGFQALHERTISGGGFGGSAFGCVAALALMGHTPILVEPFGSNFFVRLV